MGHFTLEIIKQERRTPASFAVSTLTLRVLLHLDALRVCASHRKTFSSAQTLRAQVSALTTFADSPFARTQARPNRKKHADQALKLLASGSLPHIFRAFSFSAAEVGLRFAPLRRFPIQISRQGELNKGTGQTASAFADAERSEVLRDRPLPGFVKDALSFFAKLWPSSRIIKTRAHLPPFAVPLRFALSSLGLRFVKTCKSRFWRWAKRSSIKLLSFRQVARPRCGRFSSLTPLQGDALRAQVSAGFAHLWFLLRFRRRRAQQGAGLHAVAVPPRLLPNGIGAGRLPASGKNTSARQPSKRHAGACCEDARIEKTSNFHRFGQSRPPQKRKPARLPSAFHEGAFTQLSFRSRVDAHPPIKSNLSTTILLKPINGAKNAPLDFNKISLLKAWRVSAPLPPRSLPFAPDGAQGVRRIAPDRRGGPGAFN